MKLVLLKISIATVSCLWILPLFVGSASAHRVIVFAWAEGDTIFVESKFAGGKKVKSGKIQVLDSKGVELVADRTNDQGEYSFKAPKPMDLKILIVAGQGHQGEWSIGADELSDTPSQTASETSAEDIMQSDHNHTAALKSKDKNTAVPDMAIEPNELETIIETMLDKKLKPITRMLAEMRQKGPTARDIFAGIGYILGLVGIAAYVHSRQKRE